MNVPAHASLPYRPCVGIMILNKDGKVFVAQRIDTTSEAWQMPQGGVDEGEALEAAALREMKEEIGTNNVDIITQSAEWLHYDLPEHLIGKLWKGKYRGQKQKWFLVRFKGTDADINIATEEPEFCEWKWVAPKELPHIIVPFKRDLYSKLLVEFQDYLG